MTTKDKEADSTTTETTTVGSEDHPVRLGHVASNGIGASMYGLVQLGATKRPGLAEDLRGTVELRFREDFASVRMTFSADGILVEDSEHENGWRPELVISGSLPDIVKLTAAPCFGGLPKITDARGRAALASMVGGKIRIEGSAVLARRLLKLLEL